MNRAIVVISVVKTKILYMLASSSETKYRNLHTNPHGIRADAFVVALAVDDSEKGRGGHQWRS